jgi:hypothetical protein
MILVDGSLILTGLRKAGRSPAHPGRAASCPRFHPGAPPVIVKVGGDDFGASRLPLHLDDQ